MIEIRIRRPRKPRVFRPYLSANNRGCGNCGEFCQECMENFAAEAEYERPGHIWALDGSKIIYLEDCVAQSMLGRPLLPNETVIHKDNNPANNDRANLEIVTLPELAN